MDNLFDGFEFYGAWFKKMNVRYAGLECEVDVQLSGYDEDEKPVKEIDALDSFLKDIENVNTKIGSAVLDYYNCRRSELGYDEEYNSDYPEYKDCESVLRTLKLVGITIPDQDDYSECAVSLVFNCDWDKENGVGIRLVGDKVEEIGIQGIALY